MGAREDIIKSFRELIQFGENQIRGAEKDMLGNPVPDVADYILFRTQGLNIVRRSCGEESDHYRELRRIAEGKDSGNGSWFLPHCLGAVKAALGDFEAGRLIDLRSLVAAELLGDFLEQAEHLLESGYKDPAASLTGAVLEDTLRKLCDRQGISYGPKPTIEPLNVELAKSQLYNKLVQKQITTWADIRNNADHGHFNEYTKENVKDMLKWVRAFATEHLK